MSETRVSVKVRSRDQKRKVDLLQKTATTNFDRAVLLPKVPSEPRENGLSGGDRVGTGYSVGNTILLSSAWAFSSFIVISFPIRSDKIRKNEKIMKIVVVVRGDPGTPAPDPKPWWWWWWW